MGSWGGRPVEIASQLSPERPVRITRHRQRWEEGLIVLRSTRTFKEEARVTHIG